MNSRALFILLGVVVLAGGYYAVQSLKTTVDIEEPAARIADAEERDAAAPAADDDDGEAEVTAISDRTEARRRPLSERTIRRGAGAAALEVTPATGTPAAARPPVDAPPTDEEILAQNKAIADAANMFQSAANDPEGRIEAADKLGLIDSPESIKKALELLKSETDPDVQEALIQAMQGLDSQEQTSEQILQAMSEIYPKTENSDVKIAVQDLMGDLANPMAAAGLREVIKTGEADPFVQINAAENLLRIARENSEAVPAAERTAITEELKNQFNNGQDAEFRQQVLTALSVDSKQNQQFFKDSLQKEQNDRILQMLEQLVSSSQ